LQTGVLQFNIHRRNQEMLLDSAYDGEWRKPLRVWLTVLATLFCTEAAVMEIIPWIIPAWAPRLLEAIVDAFILTTVTAPILWFLIVRPIQEANRLRTQFLSDLFASIEVERRQIAHELHDGVGQSLTLLISGLQTAVLKIQDQELESRCRHLKELARQSLTELKRLALGLRPSLLDDLGLVPALQQIVSEFREHHSSGTWDIQLDTGELMDVRLPEAVETTLYRVTQEGLANVAKHSKATKVLIRMWKDKRSVVLQIEDNGVGITPSKLTGLNPGHLGITGMRERVALIGGTLTIDSQVGKGTRLVVRLPEIRAAK
jgi:signal transduction histidine kinase